MKRYNKEQWKTVVAVAVAGYAYKRVAQGHQAPLHIKLLLLWPLAHKWLLIQIML